MKEWQFLCKSDGDQTAETSGRGSRVERWRHCNRSWLWWGKRWFRDLWIMQKLRSEYDTKSNGTRMRAPTALASPAVDRATYRSRAPTINQNATASPGGTDQMSRGATWLHAHRDKGYGAAKARTMPELQGESYCILQTMWEENWGHQNVMITQQIATDRPRDKGETRANRAALATRKARDIEHKVGEPMAGKEADDTREKEVVATNKNMTMMGTPGEAETEATALNDTTNYALLLQVVGVAKCGTFNGGGIMGRHSLLTRATKRKKHIRNQAHSIQHRQKEIVFTALHKGSGLAADERTDMSNGGNKDIIITVNWRWEQTVTRIINIYDREDIQSRDRLAQKLKWLRIIQPGRMELTGDLNACSAWWDSRWT